MTVRRDSAADAADALRKQVWPMIRRLNLFESQPVPESTLQEAVELFAALEAMGQGGHSVRVLGERIATVQEREL